MLNHLQALRSFIMLENNLKRQEIQESMYFLASISSGLEEIVGRGAKGAAFLAGKKIGKDYSNKENIVQSENVITAIDTSKKILKKNGFFWEFEPWKKKEENEYIYANTNGDQCVKILFKDCMIRQTLYNYGHEQGGSLCFIMFGFFSSICGSILNKQVKLKILHTGPNACLKELIIKD